MTSLKTNLLGSSMATTAPLASFPGWAGPVVRAKRQAGAGDRVLNPGLSMEGATRVLEARAAAIAVNVGAIIVESRENGKAFGRQLFEHTVQAIEADVLAGRTAEGEPELAGNVPLILKRFAAAAEQITTVHALATTKPNDAGFAHWMAARSEYGAEVLKLVGGLLEDFAGSLGHADVPDDWVDDLRDVVMAFVFPGYGENPKDDAWREARAAKFDAILAEVRQRRGWGTP